jgi:hypothetical protein
MVDDLERILASEDGLQPSSGFVSDTMEALHRAATASSFPWLRFGLGVLACIVSAETGTLLLVRAAPTVALAVAAASDHTRVLGYVCLSLLGCLAYRLPRAFVRT